MVTDAYAIAASKATFPRVLICNPYPFGFKREKGEQLILEILRVLRRPGEVILLTHSSNPWCQPERVERIVSSLEGQVGSVTMTVQEIAASAAFPGHSFSKVDGSVTQPNLQITLTV